MEAHFAYRCRACLTKEEHGSLLFPLADNSIRDLFALTEIEFGPHDSLPQFLCAKCYKACVEWNNFFAMAVNTDLHLKNSHRVGVELKGDHQTEQVEQFTEESIDFEQAVIDSVDADSHMLVEETIEEIAMTQDEEDKSPERSKPKAQKRKKQGKLKDRNGKNIDYAKIERLIRASEKLEEENDWLRFQLESRSPFDEDFKLKLPLKTMEDLNELEHLMKTDPKVALKVDKVIVSKKVQENLQHLADEQVFDTFTTSSRHLCINGTKRILATDSVLMCRIIDLLGEARLKDHFRLLRSRLASSRCHKRKFLLAKREESLVEHVEPSEEF